MKRALWCGLCLLFACSSSDKAPPAAPPSYVNDAGDVDRDASKPAKKDSGVDGGTVDALAPSVTITMPTATDDPSSENVLVETSVRIRCNVEQSSMANSSPVDKSSVKITLQDQKDATKSTAGAITAISDEEFEGMFDLSALANGTLTFKCTAKDTGGTHTGTATMSTLFDLGPQITLSQPKDKGVYALKSPFLIKFTVKPSPVADPDEKAEVKSVKLTIGGADTEVTESSDTPGEYQATINFADKSTFPVAPTSAQVQVFATDGRSPNAPTRRVQADVTIDGDGPRINVLSPGNATIQHGTVPLQVEVTDPSGIMPGSLIASIDNKLYMSWKSTGMNQYTQTFDTRDIDKKNEFTQLTINLIATDSVGNTTDPATSLIIRLDNLPPVISLDPPKIREYHIVDKQIYCSQKFDPLGVSANDLGGALPLTYFRALVVDQTNSAAGSRGDYLSGTNPGQVDLYMQPLPDVPLLIDTNGDHICDEIYNNENDAAHMTLTTDQLPVKVKLSPVNPAGSSWFAKPATMNVVNDPDCPNDPNGGLDSSPGPACSEMFRVVPAPIQDRPPAVYALMPSNSNSAGECAGSGWNINGNTRGREGWLCFAARAQDNIGNIGVSAALRLCYDDTDAANGTPNCSTEAPKCTDGCLISPAQTFADDNIWKQ